MKKALLFFCLMFSASATHAQLKIDEDRLIGLYNTEEYATLFEEASSLRTKEYGRTSLVDYFLAISLCGMGEYESGKQCFGNISELYSLTVEQKQFFRTEEYNCVLQENARELTRQKYIAFNFNGGQVKTRARFSGKLGYVLDCKDSAGIRFDPRFDSVDFDNRLFPITAADEAVRYYSNLLGRSYSVSTTGRFIIITTAQNSLTSQRVGTTAQKLERAYQFYSSYFGLRPPDKLIAVYLMSNKENLRNVARATHGIFLPQSNIGYSVLNDLSVLGNSSDKYVGTIYHELFHIMVRTDIGDIPGWLDEGIASLYATSSWHGALLVGDTDQWRTQVLRDYYKAHERLPSLRELIENNWSEFSHQEQDVCDLAVNYALAHHLAIFFQEQGLLRDVVTAFKNRSYDTTHTIAAIRKSSEVLESVVGCSIDILQTRFNGWMDHTYRITVGRREDKSGSNSPAMNQMKGELQQRLDGASEAFALNQTLQTFLGDTLAADTRARLLKLQQDYARLQSEEPELFEVQVQSELPSWASASFRERLMQYITEAKLFIDVERKGEKAR